jgi:hypothetical protein
MSLSAILVIGARNSSPHEPALQFVPSAILLMALTVRAFFSGTLSMFAASRL